MDKKGLEQFKKDSDEILKGIEKLQGEIQRYKSGAESFQVAAELLQEVAKQHEEVSGNLKEYISGLYDIDTEKLIEVVRKMEGEAGKMTREIQIANKTTGELLPMVNDLWGLTEDFGKKIEEIIGRVEEISKRIGAVEDGYEEVSRELKERAKEEGAIRERIEESKIWIDRLMEKMGKMEGVAQRIENSEKRIEEKIKAMK